MKTDLSKVESKKELLALQRFFAEKIRTPLKDGDVISPDSKIDEMIISNGKTDPTGRLQFYARQYWWRIIGSFDEDFPNVQKLLTKEEYKNLKLAYLEKFPSISFTLRHLGSRFSAFVLEGSEFIGEKIPVVYDAALFDWAKMEAFELAHNPPITIEDVSARNFVSKKLFLQPHVRLLNLNYPIDDLNKESDFQVKEVASNVASQNNEITTEDLSAELKKRKTLLALHRYQGKIFVKRLTEIEFEILCKFQKGYSLKNFADDAGSILGEMNESDLQMYFNGLMSLGWLYLKKKNM